MGNYGFPDYSNSGGARAVSQSTRKAIASSRRVANVLSTGSNAAGSLSSSSNVAILERGELASATVSQIGAILGVGQTWLWQEVNLGSVPAYAGRFTVTLSGATVGQLALVVEYPVTMSNGELGDRCEADTVTLAGHVLSDDQVTVYWRSSGPLAGLRAFAFTTVSLA